MKKIYSGFTLTLHQNTDVRDRQVRHRLYHLYLAKIITGLCLEAPRYISITLVTQSLDTVKQPRLSEPIGIYSLSPENLVTFPAE